jgi:DNA-binding transcriptional LysR family regulator
LADLKKISLGDLQLLVDLPRYQSLRSWAAKNRMSPIAASRLIQKLEDAIGTQIIHRSAIGFTLTASGDNLIKRAMELLQAASGLGSLSTQDPLSGFKRTLTFGSRGFLNVAVAGPVSESVRATTTNEGIRFVDLSPEETVDAMRVGALDVVLSVGELSVPKDWVSHQVGYVEWRVFGRKHHPLVFSVNIDQDVANYRIIHHAYWNGKRIINNEGLKHPVTGRALTGFGAETALAALSISCVTDQIVYAPKIAAKHLLELNLIQEIPLKLGIDSRVPAILYVASSRVSRQTLNGLQSVLKDLFVRS